MHRALLAGSLCLAGTAGADTRVELAPVPDLDLLATVFHLDRFDARDERTGWTGSAVVGLGIGREAEHDSLAATAGLAAGDRTEHVTLAATSELATFASGVTRGRHRGLVELRTDDDGSRDNFGG